MARSFDPAVVANFGLDQFTQAARRIADDAVVTPILPYHGPAPAGRILLKPENLQPLGSFKIRCAANVAAALETLADGRLSTASAGNFAQGLALASRRRGIALTVHVPATAARVKVAALAGLGARVVEHGFDEWWGIMTTRATGADDGLFVHPVCEPEVIAGNGTIGLEIAAQATAVDTVVVPFGGGGLASGIALALRACGSRARIVAVEVETSTPFAAAHEAGAPMVVDRHPSFVDGIGSTRVLDQMWPLVRDLIDEVIVVSLDEVRAALRSAALDNHLILEGAGAAALAGALRCGGDRVCAVLSGGNIDPAVLAGVLSPA